MAFREDFVWGAASSAYQTEGFPAADGGGESIWDVFAAGREPLQTETTALLPATAITALQRISGF